MSYSTDNDHTSFSDWRAERTDSRHLVQKLRVNLNMFLKTKSSYPINSEQHNSSWSISAWQLAVQQDLPSVRDISQVYDYTEICYILMTKCLAATDP